MPKAKVSSSPEYWTTTKHAIYHREAACVLNQKKEHYIRINELKNMTKQKIRFDCGFFIAKTKNCFCWMSLFFVQQCQKPCATLAEAFEEIFVWKLAKFAGSKNHSRDPTCEKHGKHKKKQVIESLVKTEEAASNCWDCSFAFSLFVPQQRLIFFFSVISIVCKYQVLYYLQIKW